MPEPVAARKQDNVPDEDNGRIPVLQLELQHIHEGIKELNGVFREHCQQAEETRTNQALGMQEQAAHRAALAATTTALALKADARELAEVRAMVKNPWVIALGSGGTVGIILQVVPIILKALGGP